MKIYFTASARGKKSYEDSYEKILGTTPISSCDQKNIKFLITMGGDGTILRIAHQYLPQDSTGVTFQPLLDSNRYVSSTFTVGGSNLGADNPYVLFRRIGSPGTFTIQIWTDSTGSPGTLVASATSTTTTVLLLFFTLKKLYRR